MDGRQIEGSNIHIRAFDSSLPLDKAAASRAVFVIVAGSDGRADGRAETLLEPAT